MDVKLVGGDAGDDFAEGLLEFMVVSWGRQVEAAASPVGVGVGGRPAAGVVEVAEALAAQGG